MKIQYLAVVFIIIMLPISLVFSAYIGTQVDTLRLQLDYDDKLDNATYDAIKAFQLNTVNSSTSDLTNSKIRDIEAAANSFFTSISTSFNMAGYNSDVLQEYVPALVFTMYDGFYLYSTFENTLDKDTKDALASDDGNDANDPTYQGGEEVVGLKPYVYYSCRYVKGNIDVVITYSLDNYITIQGTDQSGNIINDAGYLLDDVTYDDSTATYRDIEITKEAQLQENIGNVSYPYIKINGVKYYYDSGRGSWFSLMNGERLYEQGPFTLRENDMAYKYYKEAADFKTRLKDYGITELQVKDAQYAGSTITNEAGEIVYSFTDEGEKKIFDFENGIEEPDSDFNNHRLAVIRYVIESNLSTALANYNNGTYNFRMPKLSEEDWGRILNNVSLISFLQGLSIGGKIYNGYSVVNNNKNEEVVTEDSIYITTDDGYFHRATSVELQKAQNMGRGIFNIDFERKSIMTSDGNTHYYYPHKELGCYDCYVAQTNNNSVSNIYEYLDDFPTLAKIYYTALGRERYSMYKVFRNPEEQLNQYITQ